jgi:hypothetical protein
MARMGLLDCVDGSSWLRKADRDPTWSVSLTSFDLLSGAHRSTPGGPSVREQVLRFQLSLLDFPFLSTSCFCFRTPAADFRWAPFAAGQRAVLLAILAFKKSS